jgi:hypothetical protein
MSEHPHQKPEIVVLQAYTLDKKVLDWLLQGPAWLKYAAELQLLGLQPDVSPAFGDNAIQKLVARLKSGTAGVPAVKSGLVRYTEPGKAYWDFFFLADIGFKTADLGLEREAEEIFRYQQHEGPFVIPPNVKDNYYCMSAILVSSLAKMGYGDDPRVKKYIRAALSEQMTGGGWDCYGDNFNSEGSCPMDDLNLLMLLGQYVNYQEGPVLSGALDLLLSHWQDGSHLYGFGVGKRFRALEYPAVKYGILRVLDVLSLYPYAVKSRGFSSMLDFVHGKAVEGRYYSEVDNPAYADFDFSRAGEPSRWLTFIMNRIDKRVEEIN